MITKKELMTRLCVVEEDCEYLYNMVTDLDKRLKKLEKPEKKTVKKVKKDVKVSK